ARGVAYHVVAQRQYSRPPALEKIATHFRRNRFNEGCNRSFGVFRRDAGLQAAERPKKAAGVTASWIERVKLLWPKDIGFVARHREIGRQNADNANRLAVQIDASADGACVRTEAAH